MYRPRRGRAALLGLIAIVAMLVLGPAGPASAHATLISTDPAEGTVLEAAPDRIGFTFSESVLGVPDGVKVFDAQGEPVESSSAVSGRQLDVTLAEEVGDGTLVVVWRVVSEDGHPITGSLSFSVGAQSATVTRPPDERGRHGQGAVGAESGPRGRLRRHVPGGGTGGLRGAVRPRRAPSRTVPVVGW